MILNHLVNNSILDATMTRSFGAFNVVEELDRSRIVTINTQHNLIIHKVRDENQQPYSSYYSSHHKDVVLH